jgi:FtsP/CotA-like multicopper oxidase with cupredoxin domain
MKSTTLAVIFGAPLAAHAALTCDKRTAGAGGFGITSPCGTPAHVIDAAAAPALTEPLALTPGANGVVDISVEEQTVSTSVFSFRSRVFCSGGTCGVPGPTIKIAPGQTWSIRLTNNLPAGRSNADDANVHT